MVRRRRKTARYTDTSTTHRQNETRFSVMYSTAQLYVRFEGGPMVTSTNRRSTCFMLKNPGELLFIRDELLQARILCKQIVNEIKQERRKMGNFMSNKRDRNLLEHVDS